MKFFSIAITAFLLSSPSYGLEESSNQQGCIDPATFNAETDYFPDKAVVEESKYWTIEYRKSYKIITNKGAGETYLLYQCGTDPPADEMEAGHTAVVPVPIQNGVAFTGAIHLTHLELLGLRTEITGYLSSTDYLSSDCALDLIENGEILNILNTTDEDALKGLLTEDGGEPIIFKGAWSNVAMFKNQITVSESYENTNFGTFEWHKFYATFFNLEAEANKQYQQSQERYACMEENAAIATADTPKPTLLWAYYSTYSKGWSVGKCPNYYCEYAQACSANILDSTGGNWSVPVPGYDGVFDLSLDEILEFGKDADYWIYPSNDWQDVYSTNKEVLDEFKSVQNKKVYDYLGVGEDAWWGERRAEAGKLVCFEMKIAQHYLKVPKAKHIFFLCSSNSSLFFLHLLLRDNKFRCCSYGCLFRRWHLWNRIL